MQPTVVSEWIAALVPIAGPLLLGAVWAVVARIIRTEVTSTEYGFVYRYVMLAPLPMGALIGVLGGPVPDEFAGHVPAWLWWCTSIVPMFFVKRRIAAADAKERERW